MSAWVGDFRVGKTVRKMWNSNAVAGESVTLATNGAISAYKDGGATQSTAGVTFTEDFDGLTGVHLVAIDTSADGTFYAAGSDFEVVLSGATIDGKAINATLFSFSLENRSALMPTTDGRKLDVSAGGEAGVDWANVGSPTTTLNLSGTTVKTATDVEADTQDIQSRLPTALVSGRIDASVGAMAANTLTATAIAADAITDAKVAADVTIASVTGAVGSVTGNVGGNVVGSVGSVTGLTASNLDATISSRASATDLAAVAGYVDTEVAAIKTVTDRIDGMLELDGAVYRYTANALEQAPTGGSAPTAVAIADEVQTRTIAAVTVVNGLAANSVTAAALAADAGTEIGAAVWASGTRVLTAGTNIALAKGTGVTGFSDLDAAGVRAAVGLGSANLDTQIGDLPTNAELATALAGADDAVLAAVAGLNNLSAAQVNAEVDAALADVGLTTTVTGRIDAAITSRLSGAGYAAPDNAGVAAIKAVTDRLDDTIEDDGGTYRFTANSLEQAPTGGGGSTPEDITAAVLAAEIETGVSVGDHMRLSGAVLYNKASGLTAATKRFRDRADTKDRIVATIASGARTVTLDPS